MTAATQSGSDLGILVLLAYQGFVQELHDDMAERGYDDLGRSDGVVFRILGARPATVSELAGRLEISKQGAAQIVDDMARRGYVVRQPDPDDARAKRVILSPRGRAALDVARRFHRRYESRLVRAHGAEAVAVLRSVLTAMAAEGPDRQFRGLYL